MRSMGGGRHTYFPLGVAGNSVFAVHEGLTIVRVGGGSTVRCAVGWFWAMGR